MESYLDRLRNRPDHHKERIAFGLATFFTALVFVVWLSVLFPNGSNDIVAKEKPVEKGETPFTALKNGVAQVYEASKDLFGTSSGGKTQSLEEQYNKIKGQVESGQIKVVPDQNMSQ